MTAGSPHRPCFCAFRAASHTLLLLALLFPAVSFLRAGSAPNVPPTASAASNPATSNTDQDHPNSGKNNTALEKLATMDLEALEFGDEGFDWRHDWWKYLILVFASLLALFLFLLLARMLFSLVASLACMLISLIGALIMAPPLATRLDHYISAPLFDVVTTRHLALALCFVVCYLVTSLILRLVYPPKPSGKK